MMNNKLIKSIRYILVTILAIFCVCGNVYAATRVVDSLADMNDTVSNTSKAGTITNSRINGTSCSLFNVSVAKNASKESGHVNKSGKYVGPYIDNQGNMIYNVVGAGENCSGSYNAVCLDPNFDGVKTGQTIQYKAEPIDPTSLFGRRMQVLYQKLGCTPSPGDEACYFKAEVAARFIAVAPDSDYQTRSNTAKSRFNSHLQDYISGSLTGTAAAEGRALANEVLAEVTSASISSNDGLNSTMGISINQVGGSNYNGSSYGILVNVTVENCQNQNCVPDDGSAISLDGGGTLKSVSYDEGSKTKTFTYEVSGLGGSSDECFSKDLGATLNYGGGGANDVRNVMQISPIDKTYDDRQNYIVFADGNGGNIRNSQPISNCGDNSDDDGNDDDGGDSCPSDAELACEADDENFIVVNEGSQGGGSTDWEGCIIGHTDSRGNSYDVVNTTKLYRDEGREDQKSLVKNESLSEDVALFDRTDAILGFTSDESGGGTTSGDSHSIDDSDFCIISCKEKYAFILPGNKKEVKQGTFFSFQVNHDWEKHAVVGISAERTCVSSSMQTGNFNNRVKDLRKQQIDFYNMYLFYKQLYNAMDSAEATNEYKDTKTDPLCKNDPADVPSGPRYLEEIGQTCGEVLQKDKFRDNWWVPTWNGSSIEFEYKWYKLPGGGNDLNSTELEEGTPIKVTLNQSFQEVMQKNLQIDKKDFSFYEEYYPDYKSAWNHKMSVEQYADHVDEQFEESKYIIDAWYNTRTVNTSCVEAGNSVEACYEYDDYEEHTDWKYQMTYLENSREHEADWNNRHLDPLSGNFVYEKYEPAMQQVKQAYELAKKKYEAINAQIGIQSDAMQECTNYLETMEEQNNPYRFDPIITFSYPSQPKYMEMLAPNVLENMNEGTPEVNYEKFFCAGGEICLGGSGGSGDEVTFGFGNLYSDTGDQFVEKAQQAKENIPEYEADKTEYYNVGSVGSRSTYGRFSSNGQSGCSSSYIDGKGSRSDYCYEFYQSAKQFYTQEPDGIVTTSPSGENKNILSTDGRVYPVAITTHQGQYPFYLRLANIGQFTESKSLGRIMGGGDGKKGTMSGYYGDTQVCYYEVCRYDDPDCGGGNNPSCEYNGKTYEYTKYYQKKMTFDEFKDKYCPGTSDCGNAVKKYCNNGNVDDVQALPDSKYETCLRQLINNECCDYVDNYKEKRTGKWAKLIPASIWSKYQKDCAKTNACTSFTIISSDYVGAETNLSDLSSVINNGALQVNARAVSLNNLFPNNQNGFNWNTPEAQDILVAIETIGDGIFEGTGKYGEDQYLDYSATIDSKCADEIRKYNQTQEGNGSGYGNGGFNDYTNTMVNSHGQYVKDDVNTSQIEDHTYGQQVDMSTQFRDLVTRYCKFEGKPAPDLIVDTTSLVLEPWQYKEKFSD